VLRDGGIVVYPTDSCYALGCRLDDKDVVTRIRQIRQLDEQHHLTLMCRDLSEISRYARVDNSKFRLLKSNTPGSYTFILEATRRCRNACSIPSAAPSASAFQIIRWHWRCWKNWVSRCPVPR